MNGLHDVLFHSLVNSFCNSNISTGIWSMSSCVKFCLVKWTNGNDPWNHLILRSSTIFDNNFHLVRCLLYSWGKCITGLGAAADSCRGGRPDVRGKIGFLCQHLLVCKDDHQVELGGPNRDQVRLQGFQCSHSWGKIDVGSDKEAADSKMRGSRHLTHLGWSFHIQIIQHFWTMKFDFRRR